MNNEQERQDGLPATEDEFVAALSPLERDVYRVHVEAGGRTWEQFLENPAGQLYDEIPDRPQLNLETKGEDYDDPVDFMLAALDEQAREFGRQVEWHDQNVPGRTKRFADAAKRLGLAHVLD